MSCLYKGIVASLVLAVTLLSGPAHSTPDWMERPGTISHAMNQQDGTHVYLDAVCVAKNKPYQYPPYYVVREPFDRTALLIVLTTPPPQLRPWQTVDVEGTITTLPSGDRALVDVRTFGYLDRESNLLYHGPLIKGLLQPTVWKWMSDLTVCSSDSRFTTITEEESPNPSPAPAAIQLSTIASAKLQADDTMVTLGCKRIDPTAYTGYFIITEDDDHNETLKVYYTSAVDITDRLCKVTGTMKTYNGERILCTDSGPGTTFDLAVDQIGSTQTAALGTIAYVKSLPNGTALAQDSLCGKVVTGIFNVSPTPIFYVQEPGGTGYDYSGIKVVSSAVVKVGDLLDIDGTIYGAPTYPECYISASTVDVVGTSPIPRPVGMNNRATSTDNFGLQPALYMDVTTDPMKMGAGLNPVGTRVKAWGRYFTRTVGGNTVYYVDDSSGLLGSVSANAHTGLGLWYVPGTSAPVWESGTSFVATTGILGAEWSDSTPQVPVPVLRMDSSSPVIDVTDDGTQTAVTTQLHFRWNVTDGESGVTDCQYAIGTTPTDPGNGYTVGWTSAGNVGETTESISLSPNTTYYIYFKATNGTGLVSTASSDGITINTSAHVVDMLSDNKDVNGEIKKYEKYEATFSINPNWIGSAMTDYNPFSPKLTPTGTGTEKWRLKGIYVDAIITKPDETVIRWPCFYDNSRGWKLRFAPSSTGTWRYHIEVRYGDGTTPEVASGPERTWTCITNTDGLSKRGFLTKDASDYRFFSFSNGEIFYPMGVHVSNNYDDTNDNGQWDPGETGNIEDLGSNGGNWTRVFQASYMFEEWTANGDKVNRFDDTENGEEKALYWDRYFNRCRDAGVYVVWVCNNWTRWKASTENPYIVESVATDKNSTFDPTNTTMREVFKRKLRWMVARYGYSTNLVGLDLINECQQGSLAQDFHNDMARFINGDDAAIPSNWPIHDSGPSSKENWFSEQPHLMTGGIQSEYYRKNRDVDWTSSNIGMTTFHGYARLADNNENLFLVDWFLDSDTDWNGINWDLGGSNWNVERLGSRLDNVQSNQGIPEGAIWEDAAVWADRMARIHYRSGYEKPMSWTEYGLEWIDDQGNWHNWDAAYQGDVNAQHAKDWFWGLTSNGISGSHWLAGYFNGDFNGGITHWNILKPLSDYLQDVDMRGMTHESYYSVTDPVYSNKRMSLWTTGTPSTQINDPDIGVFAMLGTNKAYLYVKNLSNTWYYAAGKPEWLEEMYLKVLEPVDRPSTKIKIIGMQEGDYMIERWSTRVADIGSQIKGTLESVHVGSDGFLTFPINWTEPADSPAVLDGDVEYDWAYKIQKQ